MEPHDTSTEGAQAAHPRAPITAKGAKSAQRGRAADAEAVCKVCGERGHAAGFVGAVYLDCPIMACYLCKQLGHTTATCAHRILPLVPTGVPRVDSSVAVALRRLLLPPQLSRAWSTLLRMTLARQTGEGSLVSVVAAARVSAALAPSPYRQRKLPASGGFRDHGGASAAAFPPSDSVAACPWRVTAVLQNLHSRRITALAFHPFPAHASLLVAADKCGGMSVWDTLRRRERRQLFAPHRWQVNAFDWHAPSGPGTVLSASADGTVAAVDLDAGAAMRVLLNLNPDREWSEEAAAAGSWRMATALSAGGAGSLQGGLVFVGDDAGRVWALDPRAKSAAIGSVQVMAPGGKVACVHAHPMGAPLLLTAGNDRAVRVWDVRSMRWGGGGEAASSISGSGGSSGTSRSPGRYGGSSSGGPGAGAVSEHVHPRPVTSAYWSPRTGGRVVSTCIDNRLRVWDYGALLGVRSCGGPERARPEPPQRTYVHSHEFARYLSPFRAMWDPKDPAERTVVIGRYISEAFDGVALHPVDVLDVGPNNDGGGGQAASPGRRGRGERPSLLGNGMEDLRSGEDGEGGDSDGRGGSPGLPDNSPFGADRFAAAAAAAAEEEGDAPPRLLAQLVDPLLATIPPVNAVHPAWDVIATGSSRSLYLWGPRVGGSGVERRGCGAVPCPSREAHQQRWGWRGGRDGGDSRLPASALAATPDPSHCSKKSSGLGAALATAESDESSGGDADSGRDDSGGAMPLRPPGKARGAGGGGGGAARSRQRTQRGGVEGAGLAAGQRVDSAASAAGASTRRSRRGGKRGTSPAGQAILPGALHAGAGREDIAAPVPGWSGPAAVSAAVAAAAAEAAEATRAVVSGSPPRGAAGLRTSARPATAAAAASPSLAVSPYFAARAASASPAILGSGATGRLLSFVDGPRGASGGGSESPGSLLTRRLPPHAASGGSDSEQRQPGGGRQQERAIVSPFFSSTPTRLAHPSGGNSSAHPGAGNTGATSAAAAASAATALVSSGTVAAGPLDPVPPEHSGCGSTPAGSGT